ncbi:efflux RND transporter periplasmic adaptor subunit [Parathalassolituus penaei]|uniref:Efflux RND transporter periplasmic adaptor subunit n=1 Tax=Parathalassolituus penaei TaxID=2997323 RepID=A0A9X3EC90_9GAMM|nr:efflux RND transporter periplasmic adaptor subunit [Parathalassolituus penaei]MCY0964030.1 efflux RND transporter periplasmic adaptor subunit [Parathalassolituus penaei]
MTFTRKLLSRALGIGALLATLPALAVDTQTLQTAMVPQYYNLEATLEAVNESTISAQTSGTVKAVHYDINDRVEAGALLIEIDNSQQQAALSQAEANLAQAQAADGDAQANLNRVSRLVKQGSLSQGDLDSAQARAKSSAAAVKAGEASVRQAREQLGYTRVTAPYSGIVKARLIQMGEMVAPGTPLMTGMALQPLRAVADVPQRVAREYKSADQVQVALDQQLISPDKVVLFPYADASHHSLRLRAELPAAASAGFYPGMWASVRLQTGEREAIMVPADAVLQRSEVSAVYVKTNGVLKLRQVRTGNRQDQQVEILAGLSAGDEIATNALAALAELGSQKQEQ